MAKNKKARVKTGGKAGAEPLLSLKFKDTSELKVSPNLVDQVIGQEKATEVIRKAAKQGRNVLLIGTPGTGKSMLAQAMAELLPVPSLQDIVAYPNDLDSNAPRIKVVPAGAGRKLVQESNVSAAAQANNAQMMTFVITFIVLSILSFMYFNLHMFDSVVYAAYLVIATFFMIGMTLGARTLFKQGNEVPKVLVDNADKKKAPFVDATGARAGALLGDIKHDPLQSGGLGTPAHLRIVPGAVHKANKGVLYIDELATLSPKSQQDLLTAMQEKKYSITGQSEQSSGSQVQTESVPCDFILVASGNYEALQHVHPALRSRIRGYGYEVYMNEVIDDTLESRDKLAQFVAQEVAKDKKISAFTREAVEEIVWEAKRRAARKGKLSLKLRELGGLVRTAGDLAKEKGYKVVSADEVRLAQKYARSLERQMVDTVIEQKKDYEVIKIHGSQVGRVNGLAVMGASDAGVVLPVEAEVTPGGKINEITATGGLGKIAQEAIKNVSAIVKKYFGKDLTGKHDVYVQFLQTAGGVEGDSASITVATAVFSALLGIPVRQDVAMTGSLTVRGEVLPVGGVTYKVLAAHDAGIHEVILPRKNLEDLVLPEKVMSTMRIRPVSDIREILELALVDSKAKRGALALMKRNGH